MTSRIPYICLHIRTCMHVPVAMTSTIRIIVLQFFIHEFIHYIRTRVNMNIPIPKIGALQMTTKKQNYTFLENGSILITFQYSMEIRFVNKKTLKVVHPKPNAIRKTVPRPGLNVKI
jgi:hypothetical protein